MSKKSPKKFIRNWYPVAIMMVVIFIFSNFAASSSDKQSGLVVDTIKTLLPSLENSDFLVNIVRKSAHFLEYTILGFFTARAFQKTGKSIWFSVMFCAAYATTDELHQYFVPGRSMQLSDILLDTLGATFGVFLYRITHKKYFSPSAKH